MHFFRKLMTCRRLIAVMALTMLLRSLVAVGYMLDTEPTDGGLLSIKICDGPAGINAIEGLSSQGHDHHGHHGDEEHDHAAQDHPITSCSFWSSSSQSILADISFLDIEGSSFTDEAIFYQTYFVLQQSSNTRLARAPPTPV